MANFPTDSGYRLPAEWEPHEATWISWPNRTGASFPDNLEAVAPAFLEMIRELARFERVFVNVSDESEREFICASLSEDRLSSVSFFDIPTREPWCRDYGPTFLTKGDQLGAIRWRFNAWGEKYPPFDQDNAAGRLMIDASEAEAFDPGLVFEGGGFDFDGCGTILTSESCILDPKRNPHLSRQAATEHFETLLGATRVLWMPGVSIAGDDTDGHADVLARFASPDVVLAALDEHPESPNREPLATLFDWLEKQVGASGSRLEVVALPMPRPRWDADLEGWLPQTYANFYPANECVLVPTFRDPADDQACNVIRECFPGRTVIPLDCHEIITGQGAIHCLTQQVPQATKGPVGISRSASGK